MNGDDDVARCAPGWWSGPTATHRLGDHAVLVPVKAFAHAKRRLTVALCDDDRRALVRRMAERAPVTVVNSVNPYRIEGQKTAAFEIVDSLGDAPDVHVLPVGNAGNITAYWRGYKEYRQAGQAEPRPCPGCQRPPCPADDAGLD